jgi:steroid 5-alpha reductase family enzyme
LIYSTSPALTNTAVVLFGIGGLVETLSEIQRAIFKFNRDNSMRQALGAATGLTQLSFFLLSEGKLYTGGLFSFSQHPNYLGYTMWRTGLALLSGRCRLFASAIFVLTRLQPLTGPGDVCVPVVRLHHARHPSFAALHAEVIMPAIPVF